MIRDDRVVPASCRRQGFGLERIAEPQGQGWVRILLPACWLCDTLKPEPSEDSALETAKSIFEQEDVAAAGRRCSHAHVSGHWRRCCVMPK
jgi:hypothetical protein